MNSVADTADARVSTNTGDVHSPSTQNGTYGTDGTARYYVVAAFKHPRCLGCWEPFRDDELLYIARPLARSGRPYCESCIWQRKQEDKIDDGLNASLGLGLGVTLGTVLWLVIIGTVCAANSYLSAEQWRVFELAGMLSALALVGYSIGTHLRRMS